MKRPKYFTTEKLADGDDEFEAFTEIQVIWNDHYVPEHHKEKLNDARNLTHLKCYMCVVGRKWLVLTEKQFVERY